MKYLSITLLLLAAAAFAQQTITITDYTGRGFAPDLVQYRVKPPAKASLPHIVYSMGWPIPAQLSPRAKDGSATLSFVASVPPGKESSYSLSYGTKADIAPSKLTVTKTKDVVEIANDLCAVRLPALGKTVFKTPVPASTLPAPILAFRSGASYTRWLGSGKILADLPVKSLTTSLEAGPVFAKYVYEIAWADGGYYRSTITVIDTVPVVKVLDEYDLGKIAATNLLWELCLTEGWTPVTGETAQTWGNGGVRGSTFGDLKTMKLGDKIQPYGALGSEMSQIGLTLGPTNGAPTDLLPMVGVIPLHHGNWRRIQQLPVVATADRSRLAVQFPMARSNPNSDTNPYFVGTHEDNLPVTYARREWGLALNKPALEVKANWGTDAVGPFYQLRLLYGVIGLDRYKDYITEWPDTGADYPRVYLRKSELPKLKDALAKDPTLFDQFKGHYYFRGFDTFYTLSGNPEAIAKDLYWKNQLQGYMRYFISCPTPSHHTTYEGFALLPKVEDALASPALAPADRKTLRAQLAVLAYEMCEPDAMGNGNGAHTGNPNMSIARQMWLADLVALLPDHPMYAQWRDFIAEYMEYKFATMMTPGGSWFEPGGYHMWAYERMITAMNGIEVMHPANTDRLFAYHQQGMDYVLNQLTPVDPRYGARMHPGFGNSSPNYFNSYFDAAMNFATRDPEFAGNLLWAWNANGKLPLEMATAYKPWVQPKAPALESRVFPGFGVIFRAHQGPDETYLMLRSGYDWSHWFVDQGNCVLFSKGAILLPYQPYAYYDANPYRDFAQYNELRFGDPGNQFPYGWPDCNVLDYSFGHSVQYAWMSAGYPAGFAGAPDGFTWNRQVAFLVGNTPKSPNYFVFHDTYDGPPMKQWQNFNLLGRKGDIAVNGSTLNVAGEFPTKLDLIFAGGTPPAPEMVEDNAPTNFYPSSRSGQLWTRLTQDRPVSPNWKRKDGKPVSSRPDANGNPTASPDYEQHVILRLPGDETTDRFWIAYPRGEGEAAPKVERLAKNVVKITTAESTDYVLLAPKYDTYADDALRLNLDGTAAVVRVAGQQATLALAAVPGRAGIGQKAISDDRPFEKTLPYKPFTPAHPVIDDEAFSTTPGYAPVLTGHAAVAPGVRKADNGKGMVEYVLDNATPIAVTLGDVTLEGRRAGIVITPGTVRFVAPEASYVKLVVGTKAIRGLGPFDITIDDTTLTGTVDGKMRTLVATRPRGVHRPGYYVDGVRWLAGFEVEQNGPKAEFNLAFGFAGGKHAIQVREWASPSLPPAPARMDVK
jgi:hypothetical protein